MATQEELDALTPERRHELLEQVEAALNEIAASLAHLSDEEVPELEREWTEAVDEGIRRRAIELQRQAS